MKTTMRISLLFLALGTLVAVGATTAGSSDPFPHEPHLEEADDCATCHEAGVKGAMTVKADSCAECHEDDVPGYRKMAGSGPGLVHFPHALHVDAGECKDCHKAPAMAAAKDKKSCDKCHDENGVEVAEAACASCHGKSAKKIEPPDHKGTWETSHGKAARWRVFGRHGRDCSVCHGTDSCDTCHKTQRPRSHTGLWRIRTHGAAASWDRDSCRTCHETGTCIACHKSTSPMNHIGAWSMTHGFAARSVADKSCNVCHSAGDCAACHSK